MITLPAAARSLSDLVAHAVTAYAHFLTATAGRLLDAVYAPVRYALHLVTTHPRPAGAAFLVVLAALVAACILTARAGRRPVGTYDRRNECRACGSHIADPHGVGCPLDDAADLVDVTADLGDVAGALADLAAGRRDQVAAMLAATPAPDLRAGRRG